ncbi:MAG: phosphotriesterase family protein [Bellilinea sp.]
MMASVMSVLGPIPEDRLGFTLPHEHLFTDLSCYWNGEPQADTGNVLFRQEVTLKNRNEVVLNPWSFKDNTVLDDLDSALLETRAFMQYSGKSIVDCSPCREMGRNPQGLWKVSKATGVNVIMAAGRYTLPSMTEKDKSLSVEDLERQFVNEFLNGVNGSGIKPGFLKVGFVSKIDETAEIRSLRAAGRAQKKIGCALAVHPYIWKPVSHLILDMLEEEGCDLRRVILCHQDYLGNHTQYLDSLVKRGVYIEFDTFGCGMINDRMWQQSDQEKIAFVKKQIELNNEEYILISGDMCLKIMLSKWDGIGYVNIPKFVVPAMRAAGLTESAIQAITISNPQKAFCH